VTGTFATATFALGKLRDLSGSKNIGELVLGEDSVIAKDEAHLGAASRKWIGAQRRTPIGHKNVGLFEIVNGKGHK
jgi:hypothetical protein